MSGIINQVGARSGIISGGGSASAGTVTLSGTTGLDYEEGSWTPAMSGVTFDTGTPTGTYTKIGRLVIAELTMDGTTTSGSASSVVTGLPYQCSPKRGNITYLNYYVLFATQNVGGIVSENNTQIQFLEMNFNGAWDLQDIRITGSTGALNLTAIYQSA